MITLYGIKNCDTVKRARQRLDSEGIAYRFHDFRAHGLSRELAQRWVDTLGSEGLLNRRGTTWRKLEPSVQAALDGPAAADALVANPTVIKRPVFEREGELRVGFGADEEAAVLKWLRT